MVLISVCGLSLEDLLDVDLQGVTGVTRVSEDGAERGAFGESLDEGFVQTSVEAGGKGIVVDEEDAVAFDGLLGDRKRLIDSPVEEDMEEKIFGGEVGLEVFEVKVEILLRALVGLVVDLREVLAVDLEDAEASVEPGEASRQGLVLPRTLFGRGELGLHLGADLAARAADTLFADFGDGGVADLEGVFPNPTLSARMQPS